MRFSYQNELDKAYFHYDMADGHFKDFKKRTASDKLLHNKVFNAAKNPKCDGYLRRLASLVDIFSVKRSSCANTLRSAVTHANKSATKSKIMPSKRPLNLACIA